MTSLSINLPQDFSSKVKQGDKVVAGQVVACKSTVGVNHEINLFNIFSLAPSHGGKIMVKRAGDRVEEGETVAIKKGTLGMGTKKAVSPVSGTVFKFDEASGILTIRSSEESSTEDIFSPVDGEVELCDNEKIVLKTSEGVVLASDAIGQENLEGVLLVLKRELVEGTDVNVGVKGKIACGNSFTREALAKSLGLGALGIISGKIGEEDLNELKNRMLKTPIFIVEKDDLPRLLKADGKKIYLEPGKKTIIFLKR